MEISGQLTFTIVILLSFLLLSYAYWRFVWFSRNPPRQIPQGDHILTPADGTVVYVKHVQSYEPVISIKKERPIYISDIVHDDIRGPKLLIGVFMSPFDVHHNRAPISGEIEFISHYPAVLTSYHMSSMHWRSLTKRLPIYENSPHIIHNERLVTKIRGNFKNEPIACYVVQIAGGSVKGIDYYFKDGDGLAKGDVFGAIKIGSQVDLVISWRETMTLMELKVY